MLYGVGVESQACRLRERTLSSGIVIFQVFRETVRKESMKRTIFLVACAFYLSCITSPVLFQQIAFAVETEERKDNGETSKEASYYPRNSETNFKQPAYSRSYEETERLRKIKADRVAKAKADAEYYEAKVKAMEGFPIGSKPKDDAGSQGKVVPAQRFHVSETKPPSVYDRVKTEDGAGSQGKVVPSQRFHVSETKPKEVTSKQPSDKSILTNRADIKGRAIQEERVAAAKARVEGVTKAKEEAASKADAIAELRQRIGGDKSLIKNAADLKGLAIKNERDAAKAERASNNKVEVAAEGGTTGKFSFSKDAARALAVKAEAVAKAEPISRAVPPEPVSKPLEIRTTEPSTRIPNPKANPNSIYGPYVSPAQSANILDKTTSDQEMRRAMGSFIEISRPKNQIHFFEDAGLKDVEKYKKDLEVTEKNLRELEKKKDIISISQAKRYLEVTKADLERNLEIAMQRQDFRESQSKDIDKANEIGERIKKYASLSYSDAKSDQVKSELSAHLLNDFNELARMCSPERLTDGSFFGSYCEEKSLDATVRVWASLNSTPCQIVLKTALPVLKHLKVVGFDSALTKEIDKEMRGSVGKLFHEVGKEYVYGECDKYEKFTVRGEEITEKQMCQDIKKLSGLYDVFRSNVYLDLFRAAKRSAIGAFSPCASSSDPSNALKALMGDTDKILNVVH